MNLGLEIALIFSRGRWMLACQKAHRENKRTGTVSEKTMFEVEEAERKYNELQETKRERK